MTEQTVVPSPSGEDRILEAFAYAASGMAITDLDGCFEEANGAYRDIVARTQGELGKETILSLTHPDDQERCRRELHRLLRGEVNSSVLEKRYVRPNGDAVWVRNSFSLLRGPDGRPLHIILVCNDITARRRAERLLVENEKMVVVGQLAASIAHEINNPLEAVMNLLYLVKEADSLDQARVYAGQAEEELQRAAQIATQTLRFHKQQGRAASADITEILDSVLVLFKGKLAHARIQLAYKTQDSPQLVCYPGEIRQVFANLIRNAIESMAGGGRLLLRVRPSTHWHSGEQGVRITVADSGHGMSRETRRRVYDPFFTTKGALGTGLGLWVTAGILTKHRGSMRLKSSDLPGASGTVFMLSFPGAGAEGADAGLGDLP